MNDRILDWAMKIQSIAQTGLAYCRDEFDRERYTELRELSAEMLAERTELPVGRVRELFCGESGYQTPKLDTRAAIVEDGRILLVRERDGRWALPGGWCDVDRSVAENTVKEALEETGLTVEAERLIAVQDWRRHACNYIYGIIKIFVLCRAIGGEFAQNIETTETAYFSAEELPEQLAVEKTSREQALMCLDAAAGRLPGVLFD
jgi:ADP-ribose pyrophosphatase YjhB (NUDIX family)